MDAVRAESFAHVVRGFFEAAAVPELWPGALHELALACGAEGAAANSANGLTTFETVASEGLGGMRDEFVARWQAPELNSHRARGMALLGRGWRGALTEQDCFTADELARDPFHQDYFSKGGFSSFAGLILAQAPGMMLSLSINRRPSQGPYARGEIAQINKLALHLRAAGEMAIRLGVNSSRCAIDALGAIGHPVALIGRDGRVCDMNAGFERLVGRGVSVKGGRLGSWQPDADAALAAAIGRAIQYDGALREPQSSVVLPRRRGQRPLVAQVAPVVGRAHDVLHFTAAVVTLTDLEASASGPDENLLRQAFALTASEARLAAQIAGGKTLPEIARTEGSARETLRSRLKSVFEKTRTSRQTELVLLLSNVAKSSIPRRQHPIG